MRGEHRADKGGTGCCGSPTDRLMAGLPGLISAISSVSRTKGERESTAGAVDETGSRLAVIMDMRLQRRGAARRTEGLRIQ